MILRALLFIVPIATTIPVKAVFHCAQEWLSPDGTQTVTTLSDAHGLLHACEEKYALQQQQDLIAAIKKLNSKRLLVEDTHSLALEKVVREGDGDHPPLRYGCPLDFLVHNAKQKGIDCINVECRFSLLCYADRVFDDTIDYQAARNDTLSVIDEIKNYDDGVILNPLYTGITQRCAALITTLPVNCTDKQISGFGPLIDARILHELHRSHNVKHVIIAAGERHIGGVQNYLAKLGYTKQRQAGVLARNIQLTYDPVHDTRYALNVSAFFEAFREND